MKFKSLIKLSSLVLMLGITIQTFSQSKKSNIMDNTKNENIGLLVIMKAKEGKEQEVKEFLLGGLSLVNAEPKTVSWFAFQIDEQTFGIYDTFEAEEGRLLPPGDDRRPARRLRHRGQEGSGPEV